MFNKGAASYKKNNFAFINTTTLNAPIMILFLAGYILDTYLDFFLAECLQQVRRY